MVKLSPEQTYALQSFEEGNNLFITGPGGTGKTLLIQELVKNEEKRNKKIQVCALTGCASLLLNCNARTIHSWSGIRQGRGDNDKIISGVFYNKKSLKSWKQTDILIIDEISMMSKKIFELLETIGKRTRSLYSKPFGGLQVVFVGDFYQLPPVGNIDEPDSSQFCFESAKWKEVFTIENHIILSTMFRQIDPVFRDILLNVRQGRINESQRETLQKYVDRVYDPAEHNGCIPTKLFPTKARVDQYNQNMFDKLSGQCYEYQSIIKTNCKTYMDNSNRLISTDDIEKGLIVSNTIKEKEIEMLKLNSPCISTLCLKKGASVMCTVNLDIDNGICNGSIGVVADFITRSGMPIPCVQFSNGVRKEMPIQYWHSEEYPTIAIGQFPLCLAWAMTIHKIQGATLSMAEIDIGRSIFECGQTYVALSRVKSLEGLYLSSFSAQNIRANEKVVAFYDTIPDVEYELEEEFETEKKVGLPETSQPSNFELQENPFLEFSNPEQLFFNRA
jgi:ATP-dependent DNA helicase PIF1